MFDIYLKLSIVSLKQNDSNKEIQMLQSAVNIKPNDFIPNYRLAIAFEKSGSKNNTLKYYEAILKNPLLNIEQLKIFILDQINRILSMGLMPNPPVLGKRSTFSK